MIRYKEKQEVTTEELLNLLVSLEKPTLSNIVTNTNVRMKKTDNPYYDKVRKMTSGNYLICSNYEMRVINQCKREGIDFEFESLENKVGTHISKSVLYNKEKNKHYLMVEYFGEVKPKSTYYMGEDTIEKTLFESYMYQKSDSSRQPQERKVNVLSFDIDNIKEFSLKGIKYIVKNH